MEDQNLTSLNTGAVEVFDLDFLSFRFDRLNYSVPEGDPLRYMSPQCIQWYSVVYVWPAAHGVSDLIVGVARSPAPEGAFSVSNNHAHTLCMSISVGEDVHQAVRTCMLR